MNLSEAKLIDFAKQKAKTTDEVVIVWSELRNLHLSFFDFSRIHTDLESCGSRMLFCLFRRPEINGITGVLFSVLLSCEI